MAKNNETFVRITNKDIFDKLTQIEIHVMKTNGKVRLNTWRSILSLGLSVSLMLGLLGIKFL